MTLTVREVQENLQHMDDLRARIVNLSKDIGTFHDGIYLRDQIKSSVLELKQLSLSVKAEIEALKSNDESSNEASSLHASFEVLSVKIKEALPDVIASLKSAEVPQQSSSYEATPNQTSTSSPNKRNPLEMLNTPLLDQSQLDQETDQLEELESDVNSILNDMREINRLFNSAMKEVQAQRHKLTSAENYTGQGKQNMEKGNEQLDKADGHQKCSKKSLCAILIIVFLVVLAVAAYFLYKYFKKKNDDKKE